MSQTIRVSYINIVPSNWERFVSASESLGWAKKSLAQQVIHSFFSKHNDYYCRAALADAKARDMSESDYYQCLYEDIGLADYHGARPAFGQSPLDTVPDVAATSENRQHYNTITCGDFYYVMFQVALIVERAKPVPLVSRIVAWHINQYWKDRYQPQIDHHTQMKFILEN